MRKKLFLISLVLLGVVFLSSCSGAVRANTWPGLTASEDTAYLADIDSVYAVNLKDGREAWRFSDKDDNKALFYAPPAITPDGLVIVGSASGKYKLYALDPQDMIKGEKTNSPTAAWTFTEAGSPWVAAPLIVDNLLFAPNSDGNIYILDLSDGQSQKQPVKVVELGGQLWAQPVTDGKRVFVTSIDHSVIAVDIETYNVAWNIDIPAAIPGGLAVGSDGMLYVGSLASKLEQIDPETGQHKSAFEAKDWLWSAPAVNGDLLYFGDVSGSFYSFNTADAKLDWSIQPDGAITAGALFHNDLIVLATESGWIYAVDKDGNPKWSDEVGGKIYTTPVAVGDLTLIAPLETEFHLVALHSDGSPAWKFVPEK
jgi:outer membrane protein assembly factor BamB